MRRINRYRSPSDWGISALPAGIEIAVLTMPLAAAIELFLILLLPCIAATGHAAAPTTVLLILLGLLGTTAALLATALSTPFVAGLIFLILVHRDASSA
jgi:hypothetical protein